MSIVPRIPDAKFVDQATGNPTQGFVGRPSDEFSVRVQFFGDIPRDGVNYAWDVDPPYAVEWIDQRFEFWRSFRIIEHGWIRCTLTDMNGFTYSVPAVAVRSSSKAADSGTDGV